MDGGYGLDECMRFMQSFEADGTVDYFNLDIGGNWGAITYLQHGMYPEAAWAQMCGEAKAATSLPVLYVGRVVHAETAEKVIADGDADMVGMVRALIADREWLRKTLDGRPDEVRPCIALNDCIHRYTLEGLSFGCGVNPHAGRESLPPVAAADQPVRLLVVGGGPAGMELAANAAERGHEVELWEAKPELGGRFAIAAQLRANPTYRDWIDWSAARLPRLGVDTYLGRRAEVRAVLDGGFDVVAFATGARGRRPGIPGEYLPHVTGADAVILGIARPLGRRVLVIAADDGPAPLTVSDHLAHLGHEVVLAFETPGPSPLVGKYSAGRDVREPRRGRRRDHADGRGHRDPADRGGVRARLQPPQVHGRRHRLRRPGHRGHRQRRPLPGRVVPPSAHAPAGRRLGAPAHDLRDQAGLRAGPAALTPVIERADVRRSGPMRRECLHARRIRVDASGPISSAG